MTVAEQMIKDIAHWKEQRNIAIQKLEEIEDNFAGMELVYQGDYAQVMHLYGDMEYACLYVENAAGESWEVDLSIEELLELVRK